jgi:hypothetical protein
LDEVPGRVHSQPLGYWFTCAQFFLSRQNDGGASRLGGRGCGSRIRSGNWRFHRIYTARVAPSIEVRSDRNQSAIRRDFQGRVPRHSLVRRLGRECRRDLRVHADFGCRLHHLWTALGVLSEIRAGCVSESNDERVEAGRKVCHIRVFAELSSADGQTSRKVVADIFHNGFQKSYHLVQSPACLCVPLPTLNASCKGPHGKTTQLSFVRRNLVTSTRYLCL